MRNRLAFCLRLGVLCSALFACATDESSGPSDPNEPPLPPAMRWSENATWPGGVLPAAGDAVVIPADRTVILDVSPPALASLTVEGALTFDDRDLDLAAGWILVRGTFRVGTAADPFLHRATITLTGPSDGPSIEAMGNRVLGVTNGTLDLHGEPRTGWTRLAATAPTGATTLVLATAPDWRAGDKLVVASSDFDPGHAEIVTVLDRSGTTVTLAQPLAYPHYGELQTIEGRTVDERAEVGLLTRNIVVQGDSATSAAGYGGHIMGMGGTLRVEGVTLHFMGQKNLVARYPMHWHMMGSVDGQYFARSSVWKSFNRCVTVHGTDNARVEDNVCYDHLGHGYFLEDGAETGNLIAGNLGVRTRNAASGEGVLPTDGSAATFWITNPDNTVRGNVAAGSDGFGFWYALPAAPTGLSSGAGNLPRTTPLREFSGNVAHSNRRPGLNVDDGPRADGNTEVVFYSPRTDPGDANTAVVASFTDFTAYKHAGRAVWLRGRDHRLANAILADNATGATFASSETFVEDALFVGETANGFGTLGAGTPRRGYEFYDGRVGADRVTFVNYTATGSIPSSALGFNRNNGFSVSPANFAGALTFVNANPFYLETPHADKDGDKAAVFIDRDGAVSGGAGQYVVANSPILATGACTLRAEWNAYVCPHRFVRFSVRSDAEVVAPLTLTRDDAAAVTLVGVPDNPNSAHTSMVPGRAFTIQYAGAVPLRPRLSLGNSVEGEGVRLTVPYPQAALRVIRDFNSSQPLAAATDLAELEASTGDRYWYDAGTGMLHLKLITRTGRTSATLQVEPM
ncbi:MAG TPA: G8 domain-containing protein [Gemmatimonadales bacterium]|nr:G8 domain-containing protein [Gemmatimonadales bacterium]